MVKFLAEDILKYFSYFPWKTGFDILCKLSPVETICMKCQILFPEKNMKYILNCLLQKILHTVIRVKSVPLCPDFMLVVLVNYRVMSK